MGLFTNPRRSNLGPSGAGSVNIVTKHHKFKKRKKKLKKVQKRHECGLIFALNVYFVCKHRGVIQINSYVLGLWLFFDKKKAEDRWLLWRFFFFLFMVQKLGYLSGARQDYCVVLVFLRFGTKNFLNGLQLGKMANSS